MRTSCVLLCGHSHVNNRTSSVRREDTTIHRAYAQEKPNRRLRTALPTGQSDFLLEPRWSPPSSLTPPKNRTPLSYSYCSCSRCRARTHAFRLAAATYGRLFCAFVSKTRGPFYSTRRRAQLTHDKQNERSRLVNARNGWMGTSATVERVLRIVKRLYCVRMWIVLYLYVSGTRDCA